MHSSLARALGVVLYLAPALGAFAGGSGLNVVVVVNQNSSNSVQLANYYCEQRNIPPQNVLRINWAGGNFMWTLSDFQNTLATPLAAMLASRGLTNQIDYVVLSMDIPYHVSATNGVNSTTSSLYYGFVPDGPAPGPGLPTSCSLPDASSNSYAGSELPFRSIAPGSGAGSWLVTMLTASNLNFAMQAVNQGVNSDASYPTQTVYLAKSTDSARNIRFVGYDNAEFNALMNGKYSIERINNSNSPFGLPLMLGYQNGLYQFTIQPNAFVPGGLADTLTSFGGAIFEVTDHTTLLVWIQAGATGSYGTIIEPCAYLEKFPSAMDYFYQSRGFNMAECYYQSVTNPYQGLIVGEPLAAPFAQAGSGTWNNLPDDALLGGTTNLSLNFNAADTAHPLQQVDLFLDGTFLTTVTNLTPRQGNVLYVTLPGNSTMNYTVPANATLSSIARGVSGVLDSFLNSNATQVASFPHGDRIELHSGNPNLTGSQVPVTVSNSIGTAAALTTQLQAVRTNFLDSVAWGLRQFTFGGTLIGGDTLQLVVTKTNGTQITVTSVNNTSGQTMTGFVQQFADAIDATNALQGADGVAAEDVATSDTGGAQFNLRALSEGIAAAQIQANISGSLTINVSPTGAQTLTGNISDLQPRDHLYVTAGLTGLSLTVPFKTTGLPDGYHQLTAVAYEGTSVRTETRASQMVQIQNTPLTATFSSSVTGSNAAVGGTLQFSVAASGGTISQIQLFSTGGAVGTTNNQSTAVFSVPGTNLDLGLHPFYAVVTDSLNQQYRTQTIWIRLINGSEAPFSISISAPPPTLMWPATPGLSYDVLSVTDLSAPFQVYGTVVPSNSPAQWTDTNPAAPQRFYQVRVTP